jgi:hypothetical protein
MRRWLRRKARGFCSSCILCQPVGLEFSLALSGADVFGLGIFGGFGVSGFLSGIGIGAPWG